MIKKLFKIIKYNILAIFFARQKMKKMKRLQKERSQNFIKLLNTDVVLKVDGKIHKGILIAGEGTLYNVIRCNKPIITFNYNQVINISDNIITISMWKYYE